MSGLIREDWRRGVPFPDGTRQYSAVTDADRKRWNEAYTHSQVIGNPHRTTWDQLIGKPNVSLVGHHHTIPDVDGLAEALVSQEIRFLDPVTGKKWKLEVAEVDGVPHLRPVNPV